MNMPAPPGLQDLVGGYDGKQQHPVEYIVDSWKRSLGLWPDEAAVLENLDELVED